MIKRFRPLLILLIWLLLVACTRSEPAALPAAETQVLLVNSELIAGPNRFTIALQDEGGNLIHEADVHLQYFDISDADNPVAESAASAETIRSADGRVTLYTHHRRFDQPGAWGVEISANLPDDRQAVQRISFNVLPESTAVTPGEAVPFVDTATAVSVNGDLAQITTAEKPNPAFYELNLKEALTNGKPTLLYFATPAFCQTKVCRPGYNEFNQLYNIVGDDYNFIHVEVFTDLENPEASGWPLAPAMEAFGLSTEPWLYVIDSKGMVAFRVEGLFSAPEMEKILQGLEEFN